jgi:hypothetical protein
VDFHLVSHTHWDREWYHTAEVFRQRLVDLIDELIDNPPPDGEAFLLDGQAIVLDDYLDVRPSRRDALAALLRSGRIEAGPWFVLADELIPSGEALIRNLLLGRHSLAALGAVSPPVLYCPDSFGHPATLPEIANGFGLPLIILWRGCGGRRWPAGDVVRWVGPSGVESLVYHLPPDGYEFGSSLPPEGEAAAARWTKMRETLSGRASAGIALIQNGADHHARQMHRDAAVAELARLAGKTGDRLHRGSLRGFAEALLARAAAQRLPVIAGELRDSYGYTWTLQGTFATRAAQKRANAMTERALRRAEAWTAVARLAGAPGRVDHLRAAWRTLLESQPHDTLCGTSIDEVAAAADVRMRAARLEAEALADAAIACLVQRDAEVAEPGTPPRDLIVIENAVPYARGGVAIIEYVEKLADEPVGPGSGGGPRIAAVAESVGAGPRLPRGVQLLSSKVGRSRIEGARRYPDNDIARISSIAAYIPLHQGMSVSATLGVPNELARTSTVRVARDGMQSGAMRLGFDKLGRIDLTNGSQAIRDAMRIEDRTDAGDLYTPSIRGPAGSARMTRQRVVHKGPLIGELAQQWVIARENARRGESLAEIEVSWRLVADSPVARLEVRGVNRATNHRLRIGFATALAGASVIADAAFGPVERKPILASDEDLRMETPPPTAPLHRYVSVFSKIGGATVHSDGLAEYEVDGDGTVWVTLVRAVGDLSRNDLPERPGHAGWPEDVPAAQCLGPFEAAFALHLHGPSSAAVQQEIARESDRFLEPIRGFTLRSATTAVQSAGGIELAGPGLSASAIKESDDGRAIVLRCINLTDREQKGVWTLSAPIAEAFIARLDESTGERLAVSHDAGRSVIRFDAAARGIVTIVVVRG